MHALCNKRSTTCFQHVSTGNEGYRPVGPFGPLLWTCSRTFTCNILVFLTDAPDGFEKVLGVFTIMFTSYFGGLEF
jgi:hypothetical protein